MGYELDTALTQYKYSIQMPSITLLAQLTRTKFVNTLEGITIRVKANSIH